MLCRKRRMVRPGNRHAQGARINRLATARKRFRRLPRLRQSRHTPFAVGPDHCWISENRLDATFGFTTADRLGRSSKTGTFLRRHSPACPGHLSWHVRAAMVWTSRIGASLTGHGRGRSHLVMASAGPAIHASLMLVTALAPVIGYDKASQIAHYAMDNVLTLKEAGLCHRGRIRSCR